MPTKTVPATDPSPRATAQGRCDLKSGKLIVTPELAQQILTDYRYPKQRVVREDRVLHLAEQLEKGHWEPTAFKIVYCQETELFYLIDGQHRLSAITLAGKAAELWLILLVKETFAEVEAAYRRTDIGAGRTLQDRLRASDLTDLPLTDWELRGLGLAVAVIADGFSSNSPFQRKYNEAIRDDDSRINLIRDWAEEARTYYDCLRGCVHEDQGKFRNATLTAVALVTIRYQREKAIQWWTEVAMNDGLERDTPQWVFRNRLLYRNPGDRYQKNNQPVEFARRIASCWNAYFRGKTLSNTLIKNMDANLNLEGTPYRYERLLKIGADGKTGGGAAGENPEGKG